MAQYNNNLKFDVKDSGIYCDGIKISEYVKVTALVKKFDDKCWKTRLEFNDMNGEKCIIDVDNEKILNIGDLIKELIRKGLCPNIDSRKFKLYLSESFKKTELLKRYIEVNQTGWIDDVTFLCPSFSVSKSENNFIMSESDDIGYAISGTLDEWRENVANLCQNNSLLTFSLCVTLSPLLLKDLPEINTAIFHLVGRSSIGKTTALKVAASIWGCPKKYIKQWRATGNAHEGIAESHNDSLLVLDEIGQADDKDIQSIIYMLGNGKGKARMTVDATLKHTKSWRLFCISSGEVGIREKIEAAGKHVHGGVLVRCIDIEAESKNGIGIFDDLHGYKDGNEFATHLTEVTSKYYGTPAKYFAQGILETDKEVILNIFSETLKRIKARLKLENIKDGVISRILNYFALVGTAGILASSDYLGILNHNCTAIDDVICNILQRCLENIYNQEDEEVEIIENFKDWLKRNEIYFITASLSNDTSAEKIRKIQTIDEPRTQIFGYRIPKKGVYYILPDCFNKEFCKDISSKSVKSILIKRGILQEIVECEGGKLKNRNPKVIVNNTKEKRYLEIAE